MSEILFLVHRIPYPPDKGDKIRAFHMLKWLAARFQVHLGGFVDDPRDWRHLPQLRALCSQVCLRPLKPGLARLRSLKGFKTGEALTFPYYRDQALHTWVDRLAQERPIRAVIAFSTCMTQYATGAYCGRRIVDFVDLDSDKWRQFATVRVWPMSWVYRREARKLAQSEARIATEFDAAMLVSSAEAELFRQVSPKAGNRVTVVKNGVDTEFFSPSHKGLSPYDSNTVALVFTGAMDYWPNVDAVTWFVREVLPRIRQRVENAELHIVGARPTRAVLALAKRPGVHVVGPVIDVRPYLGHAKMAIAPLRIARGVQNKVLEAMAMARPVLMTRAAKAGLEADPLCDALTAFDPQDMVDSAVVLIKIAGSSKVGERCRGYVKQHYDWARNLHGLGALMATPLEGPPAMVEAS